MTVDRATDPRPYRCANRSCGREETGETIPKGWFGVRQYPGDRELRAVNLGIYCSLSCLGAAVGAMQDREKASA